MIHKNPFEAVKYDHQSSISNAELANNLRSMGKGGSQALNLHLEAVARRLLFMLSLKGFVFMNIESLKEILFSISSHSRQATQTRNNLHKENTAELLQSCRDRVSHMHISFHQQAQQLSRQISSMRLRRMLWR